ncbi:hypothetical protein BaRGS_00001742 [Batillaria attramentaria]|uniref:Uncharacterized protein n=1 Tax=Batillaria attramentaria TaxID=370345 RepID=A0ABD0M560_9CAEN
MEVRKKDNKSGASEVQANNDESSVFLLYEILNCLRQSCILKVGETAEMEVRKKDNKSGASEVQANNDESSVLLLYEILN